VWIHREILGTLEMATNFHRVKLTMCLSSSLPSDWILLDIERCLLTDRIRELAIVTGGEEIRLNHDRLIEAIDHLEQARVIVGHNLRRHDIPHLYRLAGRQRPEGLEERLCDTLELSNLFLVGQATHSLNKLYRKEIGLSDPVEDARESYEVYQRCQANNSLPILVRYWATRLLPDRYLTSDHHGWGLIEPYDIAMNSSKWETLRLRHPWLNTRGLQEYLEGLGRSSDNLGAIVFLHWLYRINDPAACRPKWLELELPTFREAEEHAMSLLISEPELTSELQYFFGDNYNFREGQLEIIRAMLDPSRVPLGILPTGGGKSITFQLSALILSRRYRGLSIIVSPLQALMEDQVISLQLKLEEQGLRDYVSRVAYLTGSQTLTEQRNVIDGIHRGQIDILYLSPERLRQPTIQRLLQRRSPYLWVLDEAHTLSQWGHDFRPDFLRIIQAIQETNPNNRTPRLGFVTATATHQVIEDLQNQIHTLHPTWDLQRVPNGELFQWRPEIQTHIENLEKPQSFSPRNLTEVQDTARFQRVLEILAECRRNERLGASENSIGSVAIIYTPTRKMAEMYAQALQNNNYRANAFHSRVRSSDKKEILQKFKQGELEVVVATNAFGMGIDRAGILTVIHVAPPATPEAYVQEIGRLARNEGEQGHAYLFLDEVADF
jgi:ATP-dependent DNA helicase RecQ